MQRLEIACRAVEAGRGIAGVRDRDLAQTCGEAHGAGTRERRSATPDALAHSARAPVLAARSRVTWIQVLAVLSHVFRCAAENKILLRSVLESIFIPGLHFPAIFLSAVDRLRM